MLNIIKNIKLFSVLIILLCSVFYLESCKIFKGSKNKKEDTFKSRRKVRKSFSLTYDSLTTPDAAPSEKKFWGEAKMSWADSVFESLNEDEKIGQLFMVAAYSNRDKKHIAEIDSLILNHKIGGLIFFQGGPARQAIQTNHYQSIAKTPLFMAIDGEWGLNMRLDSTIAYPKQMTLGAIQDNRLIYDMGVNIANECKRVGLHINFAPDADINSNGLNPVIGYRAFSESKVDVTLKSIMYMKGMQDNHIMACGKHFPGHGDTDVDSHADMPKINHSFERLDSLELYPFRALINKGLKSMMVAHIEIPSLDTNKNVSASISSNVIKGLLQDSMQFHGLVFTDALNMKGVAKYYKSGELEVKALKAGNDVLLFSENIPLAITAIKEALKTGELSIHDINKSCKKILMAKEWAGLDTLKPVKISNLVNEINNPKLEAFNHKLFDAAFTVLQNKENILPLKKLDTLQIATLCIGEKDLGAFQKTVNLYGSATHFNVKNLTQKTTIDTLIESLKMFNLVLVSLENITKKSDKNFGITPETIALINRIKECSKVVINLPGNPYSLLKFDNIENIDGIVLTYERNAYTLQKAAELIFGGIDSPGRLPVSVIGKYKAGDGMNLGAPIRMSYVSPEDLGISSSILQKVDSLADAAIAEKATPGCQILAAKDGKVFYHKAFGKYSYEKPENVDINTIYDIASVTKITATLFATMQLFDLRKFNPEQTLKDVLPTSLNTNKSDLIIKDILTHQAGLKPFIPFYEKTINDGKLSPKIYSHSKNKIFNIQIADSLFINANYSDSIYSQVWNSSIKPSGKYVYSDLGFYLTKMMCEYLSNRSLDQYMRPIYRKLGANSTGYLPLERFSKKIIAPTEEDKIFRKQILQGYVHDPGAAMLGGIAGHAGVFSNANDLAKIMQMYINKGSYGAEQFITTSTVNYFTSCIACPEGNRRGLGFDKPEPDKTKEGPTCEAASLKSFGHTGFTGTYAWADPENGLVYIFLSNRVHPDAENKKLSKLNTRTNIHQVFYDAIKNINSK
ncbi:MAG TPA: glycoside hydrolase family 3 N-terminal domain-containing protein [Bacteroidia bacterium]|nr:glycoside hydrolase family 3 N-terminal domain-containing protein [Bacteroidia bacterium]